LIRRVEKTRFLPVIFTSSINSEDEYMVQGIDSSAVDFITKPYNSRLLQGKIRIFLELNRQRKMLEAEIEGRKQIERELREAKTRAEESDRLKSAFLSNMSHEIRTPLTTIVGMSSLLATKDFSKEKKKQIADFIEISSNGLITIINDILDLSKIEAGVIKVTKESVNVNKLLSNLYSIFLDTLEKNSKSHIELRLNIPDTTAVSLYTDENRIRQILCNLLANAVKFTDEGFIEFGYYSVNGSIDFFVTDTGGGIPSEKFNLLFRRFHKINEISRGTGLGLSIAKRLAELLGGDIHVRSEINKGSTFIFTIPHVNKSNNSETETEVKKDMNQITYNWSGRSILIAEDEYPVFFLLENLLEPTKIEIKWVNNGQAAIDQFSGNSVFDIVLLDIRMPGLDGIETFREIRKLNSEIPIIAQTAYSMDEEKEELERIGFDGFISKPFNKNEILKLIDSFLV
jgi:signal transduction histidine kinase